MRTVIGIIVGLWIGFTAGFLIGGDAALAEKPCVVSAGDLGTLWPALMNGQGKELVRENGIWCLR